MTTRLLSGPALSAGPERLDAHLARLGSLDAAHTDEVIPALEASGLLGRGGAGFPVGRKWHTVAERSSGDVTVLANGAEGEPLSAKDRALMTLRPHLVLDGADLAARATGAREVVLYVGAAHTTAQRSIEAALSERAVAGGRSSAIPIRLVQAPDRYVAGEESAAVHYVNEADARPTTTPPRPFEVGVGGRPTLVQNVESLAYAALIARRGDAWYREPGRAETPGTGLITVSGGGQRGGVREVELGTTVTEIAESAGVAKDATAAVLLGGYFGKWLDTETAWRLSLDPGEMRQDGLAFGCGVVSFLDADDCGVTATARIMEYMAGQSAAQCGPCAFGLRAIADATTRIANGVATADDLSNIERWAGTLAGRGACRHPDGAVGLLASAIDTFGDEFVLHQRARRCSRRRDSAKVA
jgi:NADH:ubiquinone oxidoreductase subunit F (NADH-binding)